MNLNQLNIHVEITQKAYRCSGTLHCLVPEKYFLRNFKIGKNKTKNIFCRDASVFLIKMTKLYFVIWKGFHYFLDEQLYVFSFCTIGALQIDLSRYVQILQSWCNLLCIIRMNNVPTSLLLTEILTFSSNYSASGYLCHCFCKEQSENII